MAKDDPPAAPEGWPKSGTLGRNNWEKAWMKMGISDDDWHRMPCSKREQIMMAVSHLKEDLDRLERGSPYTRFCGHERD